MSAPDGYFQASRTGGAPELLTCRECGASLHASGTSKHTSWHGQVVTEEKLAKVVDQITQRGQCNP